MRRMIGVVVGFTCTSISARYALAQRLLVAFSPNRRGAPLPGSRPTPGERQRKEKLVDSFTVPPPSAATVMRGRSSSWNRMRRKDDGASGPGQADSPDPRSPANKPRRGVLPPNGFLLTGRGRFLLSRQKKRGADSPENFRSPPGPPGKAPDEGLNQAGSLIRPPAAATFPHGKALRSRWVDPPSAPTGAPGSAGQRLTAGFSVRPSR